MTDTLYTSISTHVATRLMIKDLSIQRGATFIKLQWSAPDFGPYFYLQRTSCMLWHQRVPYRFFQKVIVSSATSNLVSGLKPGSRCEIRFRAVYNVATLDPGIIIIASTPIGGKVLGTI